MPSAQTKIPDVLPAPMTPASPVDATASTTDSGRDYDPEEPIPVSTAADAVEQPEHCPAEVFEDMTHHLEQLAEDNPQDDLLRRLQHMAGTRVSFSWRSNGRRVRLLPSLLPLWNVTTHMLLPNTSWPTAWEHGMEDTCRAGT